MSLLDLEAVKAHIDALGASETDEEYFERTEAVAGDARKLLVEVERCHRLMQSAYDALIQGSQTYYIRWRDALTVLEGRKPGGVS